MKKTMVEMLVMVQLFAVLGVYAGSMLINGTANQYMFGVARCWIVVVGCAVSYPAFMITIIRKLLSK